MQTFLHYRWRVPSTLHRLHLRRIIPLLLLALCVTGAKAQTNVKFNGDIRYSQWVIDSRLGDFYGNTNDFGFTTYNRDLSVKKNVTKWKKGSADPYIDYVAGLVAKATIEAAEYYKAFTWAKPWFKSVEWYGNKCTVPTSTNNLDAINASKMYFGIYNLANGSFSSNAESTTASKATTQLGNALTALGKYNQEYKSDGTGGYAFPATTTVTLGDKSISLGGGWFHKESYLNEMWLDGQYMGPATLAQLIKGYASYTPISSNDWELITKQFSIVWQMCWDEKEQLLYHAFCSEPRSNTWAADAEIWTEIQKNTQSWQGMSTAGHSAAFWGRAEGWYFLALVDVLEQMQIAGFDDNNSYYKTLKGYLDKLALGIAKRQDAKSGCWYQLIGKGGEYSAQYYNGADKGVTKNYLESSCTAIFAAAFLKATRLELLSSATDGTNTYNYKDIGTNAYMGAVAQFMKRRTDRTVDLLGCCKSAGLGTSTDFNNDKFRDGSNAYYLLGADVPPTSSSNKSDYYTEGKVMGAFIMAATEYERAPENQKDIRFSYDLAPSYTLAKGKSITAEALGSGTITYQWFKSDNTEVSGATSETFTPKESGTYYCKATNGSTTIQTSPTAVTVETAGIENGGSNGEKELFSTDFTEAAWTGVTTTSTNSTTKVTIDGTEVTLKGYKNNGFSVLDGTLTFPDNNMSDTNYYIAIPVSGVNGSITIEFGGTNNYKYRYDICSSGVTPSREETGKVSNGYVSVTETYSGTNAIIYIGRQSSYCTTISSIRITTPSSSTSTTHTITYNFNGHGENYTIDNATALPSELPTPAAVEGYTFGGWYTDSELTTPAIAGATISGNTTLYAKWTKNKYTVTATAENGSIDIKDGNDNPVQTNTQVEHGTSLTFTATANSGYEFSGWTVNGSTVSESSATYTIASLEAETNVTAHFTATSSGGDATGGSGTGTVISFPSGTTSSNENVLKVNNGSAKELSVNYGGKTYTNGVKMESSTDITLKLTAESKVTFVFDTASKKFKIDGTSYTTGNDGTYTITLDAGEHTISKVDADLTLVAVEVKSSGSSILFTTHPEDAEYVTSATATAAALTVEAQLNNFTGTVTPTINYQWFMNSKTKSTDGGVEISGQTNKSYIPDISTAGTTYYYCKASATVDEEALEAYSNIATVTVSNPTLTIVTEPVGATYAKDQTGVVPLMVEAKTNTGSTITYQWYSKTSENAASGTEIKNETSAEYLPPVDEVGTKYYYCVVTCVVTSESSLTATTKTVSITVNNEQPIYGYKVSKAGLPAPGINTSMYINTKTDGTGENLVKMTFGGWKWKNGTYTKPGSDTPITDSWKDSETVSGVTVLDGYQYWFSGTQDAKQENKDAETEMYGQIRNGWFVSPTRDKTTGVTTASHPYTLPVRGSFMTFEPTKNGTLTIYILQNGAWNTFDKDTQLDGVSYKKGAIKPGEFRMHAFQITNQRGLVLAEFAPKYSVTNNQMVQEGYSCTKYEKQPTSFNKLSKDVSDWEEFWTLSETERRAVHDNWSDAENNGCQKIIKLENGSFLAIQKAVVKYQFHVTGNETYYFFSNFSKMGFSGATFQPDADSGQPTDDTTFSGVNNSLSDTKPYTKITPTADGEIEGTGLTKYKYTINGTDIKLVDGVFIPQFKAITLNRTFKPKQWTTLTLPFNLTQTEVEQIFGKGTQILVFQDAKTEGTKLHIKFFYHEIQNILPGYPYLIRPTLVKDDQETPMESIVTSKDNAPIYTIDESGNLTSFTVYDKAINPHITQHEFVSADKKYVAKGTPDYCTQAVNGEFCKQYGEGDLFISDGNGKLYISKGSSYGKGYRSYIDYIGTETSSASTKTLSLTFSGVEDGEDDGTTTEISVAELADDVIEAFGIKGVYNLNGQKVAETTRNLPAGIYVVNGRKVVVK